MANLETGTHSPDDGGSFMRIFQRFSHTVSASIESLLDQVENQEAVARATIQQIEQGAARVRGHRKRAERKIAELEARLDAAASEAKVWKERAARMPGDREKALECVKRHLAAEETGKATRAELEQQRALRDRIAADQQAVEAKLTELRGRCAALSSREARCAAEAAAEPGDVERVFERWEARLDVTEGGVETQLHTDSLAREFGKDEERARIEAELEKILAGKEDAS
jgi:phage shock protein A